MADLDIITLNISGDMFCVSAPTLQRIPASRLANLDKTDKQYRADRNEYFFDRNSCVFPYILDVYRKGQLHFPR